MDLYPNCSIRLPIFIAIALLSVVASCCTAHSIAADLLLADGTIVDGSGREPFVGSVAVRDGKILAVGDVKNITAERTIDCQGLVICPGFIDLHNHSDHTILSEATRGAVCYVTQGCTTLVTGNCGGGRVDVGKFYEELADGGVGINIAHLVPHGSVREKVIGSVRRAPTDAVLEEMQRVAAKGMEEGAWGMSTGLQYVPSAYADTVELVAMSREIARHNGIYASHIRDEGDELLEAIEEVIQIAEQSGVPCHISHLKASKRRNWGKVRAAARIIEGARQRGLKITADQYPYTASSTSIMAMLLPEDEREGGQEATSERLKNPEEVARLRPIIAEALEARGELMIATFPPKPAWVGKMIREVAAEESRDPVDIAIELLRDGDPQGVNFGMDEADVRYVMTLPWVATASDGSSKVDDGTRPHPRSFGTFPRKIGRYAIQEQVVSLPAAIRSASGLPADILGMKDRGYVRKDLVADLVVFDPKQLEDRATYQEPFETSVGVRWVILNGEVAVADGVPQKVLAGRPLRHKSSVPATSRERSSRGNG
jgi:N-acyl-D-aspartate/D-glutamate deacylase